MRAPEKTWRQTAAFVGRVLIVRIRFIAAAVLVGGVLVSWSSIRDRFESWMLPRSGRAASVSLDTEYFCPMCPGVVSTWPEKCPVCHMTLVRRKRGDAAPLPSGVVARMQVSPYRVQLAGVRTAPARFGRLECSIRLHGQITGRQTAELLAPSIPPGASAQSDGTLTITLDEAFGRKELPAQVERIGARDGSGVVITAALLEKIPLEAVGSPVVARLSMPAAAIDGRRQRASSKAPTRADARVVYYCPDHPEQMTFKEGNCPLDQLPLVRRTLADYERMAWWCPMHPQATADHAGAKCRQCAGMELVPRIRIEPPEGEVLCIPRSAVIASGSRSVVYVEKMPGMFDGIEVALGPASDDEVAILDGLAPGEQVVVAGGFLLDAESQLNPSLAAAYFGAGTSFGGQEGTNARSEQSTVLSGGPLTQADRESAKRQKVCPVTEMELDSMGGPVKYTVDGKTVFVCCKGCESSLRKQPQRYLEALSKPPAAAAKKAP